MAVDTRQRLRATPNLRQPAAERTQADKERAVSFAAYAALVDLFPARQAVSAQRMTTLGYATDGTDTSTSAMVGTTAAQAVLDYRHADGSNQLAGYTDTCNPACYQPVNTWDKILDADRWQPLCVPTPPPGATTCAGRVQPFLTPHWLKVAPFALTSASQFRGSGPAISLTAGGKPNGKYRDEVDKMTQHSKQLDDTRKVHAEYWADGPGSVTPFSMAGAEVLTAFTGRGNFELTVTIPAGSSRVEPRTATHPGVPAKPITLKWSNFRYAAEQAGKSRQYGGSTSRTATTTPAKPAQASASRPGPRPSPTSTAPPPNPGGLAR